jgi:hypothetical protein
MLVPPWEQLELHHISNKTLSVRLAAAPGPYRLVQAHAVGRAPAGLPQLAPAGVRDPDAGQRAVQLVEELVEDAVQGLSTLSLETLRWLRSA